MKIKIADAAVSCRILKLNLERVDETLGGKIVDLFMELLPYAVQYDNALTAVQKDAQGKSREEVENMVSAKAFEKIAATEVEVAPVFTKEELSGLAKKKVISLGDMAALYNLFVIKE